MYHLSCMGFDKFYFYELRNLNILSDIPCLNYYPYLINLKKIKYFTVKSNEIISFFLGNYLLAV